MTINFPNNPTQGNTYTYQEITYTYIQPDTAFDGYWAVVNPSSLSAATSAEINAGTTNDKFNTPLGLQGSKYVREEASGETVLNHNGAERLKTTAQGVEVADRLTLGGDTYKDGVKVGITELWSGVPTITGDITLTTSFESFDYLVFVKEVTSTGGGLTKARGVYESQARVAQLLTAKKVQGCPIGDSHGSHHTWVTRVDATTLNLDTYYDRYVGGIIQILGIKMP